MNRLVFRNRSIEEDELPPPTGYSSISFKNGTQITTSSTGETKSPGGPTSLTYLEFYNNLVNSKLIPGSKYIINDYASRNFINGERIAALNESVNGGYVPQQIHTGVVERLIVEAISSNKISEIVTSLDNPNHVIKYNPYVNKIGLPATFTGDMLWDNTNNYAYVDISSTILSGHPIYVTFNINGDVYASMIVDKITDASMGSRTSNIRYIVELVGTRLIFNGITSEIFSTYVGSSLTVKYISEVAISTGLITYREDVIRGIKAPFDFVGYRFRRYYDTILGSGYWNTKPGIGWNGNYVDYRVFNESRNIEIKSGLYGNDLFSNIDNIVFFGISENVFIDGSCYENSIGDIRDTKIHGELSGNRIVELVGNIVESGKIIGNTINGGFSNNIISRSTFQGNIIGDNFVDNVIQKNFTGNTILANFQDNLINASITNTSTFSDSLYGAYSTSTSKQSDGSTKILVGAVVLGISQDLAAS